MSAATKERDRILEATEILTGPAFKQVADAAALAFLRRTGTATGEAVVNACKAEGIRPDDDRHFGHVLRRLSMAGAIERCGFAPREKGHGTAGASVWRLVQR